MSASLSANGAQTQLEIHRSIINIKYRILQTHR